MLVQRLDDGKAAAATGYRWFVPTRPSLAGYVQYAINACAAVMYRADSVSLGGSWAIRRDRFEECGLRTAWHGTLSDDLVGLARIAGCQDAPVEFEPACMLPSPLELNLPQMLEFLRRQYVIGKSYALRDVVHRSWFNRGDDGDVLGEPGGDSVRRNRRMPIGPGCRPCFASPGMG